MHLHFLSAREKTAYTSQLKGSSYKIHHVIYLQVFWDSEVTGVPLWLIAEMWKIVLN